MNVVWIDEFDYASLSTVGKKWDFKSDNLKLYKAKVYMLAMDMKLYI